MPEEEEIRVVDERAKKTIISQLKKEENGEKYHLNYKVKEMERKLLKMEEKIKDFREEKDNLMDIKKQQDLQIKNLEIEIKVLNKERKNMKKDLDFYVKEKIYFENKYKEMEMEVQSEIPSQETISYEKKIKLLIKEKKDLQIQIDKLSED